VIERRLFFVEYELVIAQYSHLFEIERSACCVCADALALAESMRGVKEKMAAVTMSRKYRW
jgi:hypothetical protein